MFISIFPIRRSNGFSYNNLMKRIIELQKINEELSCWGQETSQLLEVADKKIIELQKINGELSNWGQKLAARLESVNVNLE